MAQKIFPIVEDAEAVNIESYFVNQRKGTRWQSKRCYLIPKEDIRAVWVKTIGRKVNLYLSTDYWTFILHTEQLDKGLLLKTLSQILPAHVFSLGSRQETAIAQSYQTKFLELMEEHQGSVTISNPGRKRRIIGLVVFTVLGYVLFSGLIKEFYLSVLVSVLIGFFGYLLDRAAFKEISFSESELRLKIDHKKYQMDWKEVTGVIYTSSHINLIGAEKRLRIPIPTIITKTHVFNEDLSLSIGLLLYLKEIPFRIEDFYLPFWNKNTRVM